MVSIVIHVHALLVIRGRIAKPILMTVPQILVNTVARVEMGAPAYGKELSEDFNPLEANLLEYISFTKGCYVGQEVVARLKTYNKVQRQLVGLRWDFDSRAAPGSKLMLEGKQVGLVTSAAKSPRLDKVLGLGYVRTAQAQAGTVLSMDVGDGEVPVEVAVQPGKTHQP